MKLLIKKGAASKLAHIFIQDSSKTDGSGLTGLVYNTASLVWYYWREGASSATQVTLATATLGTWTSGGFKEMDATNMPGWYEIGIPDAILASGASSAKMHLKGATNMAPVPIEIQLVSYDPDDGVHLGLTALPNAAAEAAGGLYTRGTGAGQIKQTNNGEIDSNTTHINNVAATSVTTINANVGTTQPTNFTGTGASALVKGDVQDWAGATVAAVNVSGVPKVDVVDWLGSAPDALSTGKIPADLQLWLGSAPLALTSQLVQASVAAYASGQAPLQPTVAGRTLDVSASGEAGLDWANVGSPTSTVGLTNTTIGLLDKFSQILDAGTAQAGTSTSLTLASSASASNNYYKGAIVRIYSGTGAGQARIIQSYTGSTRFAKLSTAWVTTPDNTSIYVVFGVPLGSLLDEVNSASVHNVSGSLGQQIRLINPNTEIIYTGTAAAGSGTTITLDGGASSSDHAYETNAISITSGTGSGQSRIISGYVGSTKVATVFGTWTVTPDNTSVFEITPTGTAIVAGYVTGQDPATLVLDASDSAHDTPGTIGEDINNSGTSSDPWSTNVPGTYSAGQAGYILGTNLDSTISGVQNDTNDLQTRLPATLVDGRMDSSVGAMVANVLTAAAIATGAIDADALASDAVDEFWAKAMSDLSAVPGATASVLDAINWLYEIARNRRTQTATTETVYKNDGVTQIASSTKSDNGTTFSRDKYT